MSYYTDIAAFHHKFELEYNGKPRQLPSGLQKFRSEFMMEELVEYDQAVNAKDLVEQLDALVDLVYVALGTAYMQGFDFDEAWRRVHEANMKKVRAKSADDSKRHTAADVVKPEGWQKPDLRNLVA